MSLNPAQWAERGEIRHIVTWEDPVMHVTTKPVEAFDDDLHKLVADMFATMEAAEGVGLAAPQIGVDLALFVFVCPDADDQIHYGVVANPTVTLPEGKDRKLDAIEEGCLSWPGAYHLLARSETAICEGVDENGEAVRIEGTGLLARCLQHETDHLNGTVFGDRLSARSRRQLNEDRDAAAHLYPDDWPISPKSRPEHRTEPTGPIETVEA